MAPEGRAGSASLIPALGCSGPEQEGESPCLQGGQLLWGAGGQVRGDFYKPGAEGGLPSKGDGAETCLTQRSAIPGTALQAAPAGRSGGRQGLSDLGGGHRLGSGEPHRTPCWRAGEGLMCHVPPAHREGLEAAALFTDAGDLTARGLSSFPGGPRATAALHGASTPSSPTTAELGLAAQRGSG